MDKILFPYRGYPAYPPRDVIYPDKKSSLENLLDHFFVEERRRDGWRRLLSALETLRRKPRLLLEHLGLGPQKVEISPPLELRAPPDRYRAQYFKGGRLEPHSSWDQAILKIWDDSATEPFQTMQRQPMSLSVDPAWSPLDRRRRITTAVAAALRIHPALRRSLVAWDFGAQRLTPHVAAIEPLREAVQWLWDGMRRLPYTDAQIATAIGVCVQLASLGLSADTERKSTSQIALEVFGPAIEIEFQGGYGSYSRAYTAEKDLRAAMRDDLLQLTEEKHRDRFDTTEEILLAVFAPQRLFDFARLCALFAEQIVPWQVLARRGRVAFFTPSRLIALGNP
jgi:hypothetical protein